MVDTNDNSGPATDEQPKLLSQLNWHAANAGGALRGISEYPLYSDTHIVGERPDEFGPYAFLNAVPLPDGPGNVNAPIVVRVSLHLDTHHLPNMSQRDESLYHGGLLIDELAALISLCVGARMRAGGESRRFEPGKDPLGRPAAWNDRPKPSVGVRLAPIIKLKTGVVLRSNNIVLPAAVGTHSLDELDLLSCIPRLSSKQYVSLIRAANHYQDALWVAESEPNLAWLMLVSALETAANEFTSENGAPVERLRYSIPELASVLEEAGGPKLVARVADLIQHSLGATKKFIDFTLNFLPTAPAMRPKEEYLRIKWDKDSLKKHVLRKVYAYRSRALHGGIPFPAPMFEPPYAGVDFQLSEKPLTGLASHSHGGTWMPEDLPINLHCFHYIVRGALMNWWHSMGGDG
ncbi:hypothetical protein [Bythopirellula goksoeyrii]|uniref:Apea-like HEPN domain-containing protein n=1 Tax=Bythopirellula goksoeyrii TaxID=1400387 RepID=A0A5B9QIG5_9BACT|nr:hypothetical protein [Bythopirellula goksoeyrii]QEG36806.1 hypothetical protein Pr1d_41420 [Bythopirellula goksoeyrii]